METRHRRLLAGYALGTQLPLSFYGVILLVASVSIAASFALGLDKVGLLFLFGQGGAFLAYLVAGPLSDRVGQRKVLLGGGGICLAGSVLCTTAPSLPVLILGVAIISFGGGSLTVAGLAILNELHQERRRLMITNSQMLVSMVYFVGPVLVGYLIRWRGNWQTPYWFSSLALLLFLVPLLVFRLPPLSPKAARTELLSLSTFRSRRFSLLSLGYLLHTGAEVGVSSWLCIYLARKFAVNSLLAGLGLSLYALGMVIGRAGLSRLPERYGDTRILKFCVVGAASFIFLALFSQDYRVSVVLFAVVGFFLSANSPIILTYAGRRSSQRSGTVLGNLLVGGSFGGFVFPPVMGLLARHMGIVAVMASPLVLLMLLLVIVVVLDRISSEEPFS